MADATLGDQVAGEVPQFAHRAPEHSNLHAAVVIQVYVHGRHRQIMVFMEGPGQAFGQLPLLMIKDVNEGRDAELRVPALILELSDPCPGEITYRLGSALETADRNDAIERRHELVVDGDGDLLHPLPPGF